MSSPVSSLTASRSPSPEPLVQPDHFYGADPSHLPSPDSEGKTYLSPDDDPLAHRGIPVFKPSMHEFADFEGYMNRVECWGRRSGIVKVVPPKEWTDALPDVKPQLAGVKIKSPIEQFMRGRAGLFRQENMEKRKLMSVREWAELCAKDEFRAPGVDQVGVHNNPSAQPALRSRKKKLRGKDPEPDVKPEPTDDRPDVAMASPPNSASPDPEDTKPDDSKPRNRRVERADKDTSFLDTFGPHTDWLPVGTTPGLHHRVLRKARARLLAQLWLGKPAWYGADTMGSLFTSATTAWNVAHLPSTLSRLLPPNQGLPGVNTPYLYFGMWRATFAWHVEDMDLFSINYIHFGAPKFWYAVPQGRAGALEDTMRGYFPKDTSTCPQFLRHKSFLASPTLLAQSAVRPNHLVQHAGEFVITYPRGYHAGFNLGLNCAESVNFALDSWLDEGRKAAVCKCVDDSVRIDVDQLLEDRRIEELEKTDPAAAAQARAARDGEDFADMLPVAPEPEPEALPTSTQAPPALPSALAPLPVRLPPLPPPPRARPRCPRAPPPAHAHPAHPPAQKLTLKLGPRPEDETFPCCLCVDPSTDGLARVHDLPSAWRDLSPAARMHYPTSGAAARMGVWMAHEACALVLPETWVDDIAGGERVIFGVDGIVRGRWSLKCSTCTRARAKAHGALIQCAKGKCPKSFHVNCAKTGGAAGIAYNVMREVEKEVVLLEPVPLSAPGAPVSMEAAPEPTVRVLKVIKKIEAEALCAQHNPLILASRRASQQESLRAAVLALPPLSRIKLRVSAGVVEVTLVRVLEPRRSVEVLWDVNGEVREFKWSSIILGATSIPAVQLPDSAPYRAPYTPNSHSHAHAQYPSAGAGPTPSTSAAAQPRSSAPAGSAYSTSNAHQPQSNTYAPQTHQTQSTPHQPQSTAHQAQSASAAPAGHNPYSVFKYEYWPYTYPTANPPAGTSTSAANMPAHSNGNGNTASTTASTSAAAAQHAPGSHYANQYYPGPSQYYRAAPPAQVGAYYPQALFQTQAQTQQFQAQRGTQAPQNQFQTQAPPAPATYGAPNPNPNPNPVAHAQNNPTPAPAHTPTPAPVPSPAPTLTPPMHVDPQLA
ncbi:JmjC domain, hydroxylase-domain-containing protein [Mycena rosella]|uniref:[histone H3]-trimethyl-L-lysine(9) demethylase n=1 Tax=Mycena rosella TaxID=1033263 RepID=A0AAD7CMC6_MYCRO|nr:JmjC domain, hydroxylase-domain-containing protein [Mycena rosella]